MEDFEEAITTIEYSLSPEIELVEEIEIKSKSHNECQLHVSKKAGHRKKYLSSWKNDPASFCSSHSYDIPGIQQTKHICWLYKKLSSKSISTSNDINVEFQYEDDLHGLVLVKSFDRINKQHIKKFFVFC
ncbi:unnamed protein product [Rotaria socialis]|uniref:Uncharacterized protein n=1 Tax=Rotaria socialis TaxID=392032 RepID=A0A818CW23_9BILA|nr:unnamed protein product [Rotaria socialis]CAF3386253.1 unnamed protein product [Rotaria socialis]CAF3435705.1 unnamed protein product [Rotaria socialis]CAF4445661.1 unnamed protein product [Rotaria socialis]CAF4499931.1 unnamed protein product [Rotaria socialis]